MQEKELFFWDSEKKKKKVSWSLLIFQKNLGITLLCGSLRLSLTKIAMKTTNTRLGIVNYNILRMSHIVMGRNVSLYPNIKN